MSVPKLLTDFNMARIGSRFSNFHRRMLAGEGFQTLVPKPQSQVCGEDMKRTSFFLFSHDKLLEILSPSFCLPPEKE